MDHGNQASLSYTLKKQTTNICKISWNCVSLTLCVRVCSIGSMRTVENGGVACNYRLTRRSYYGFRELGLLEKPHILRILRNVSMISLLRNGLYTRCPSPARNTCIFRLPHSFIYFWLLGLSKLCLFAKKRRESFDFGSWENWGKKQGEFWILCVVLVWFLKKKKGLGGGGFWIKVSWCWCWVFSLIDEKV